MLPRRLWRRDEAEPASKRTGRTGESLAEEFLVRRKGFRILVRNWRAGKDEIDIVGRDGEVFVFVEVKTRSKAGLVPGYFAAVGKKKKEALRRAIKSYLRRISARPLSFRFDVVEVTLHAPEKERILHYENIPLFPKNFRVR